MNQQIEIETAAKKFEINEVQVDRVGSQSVVREITLGGTKTRLIFN